MIDTQVPILDPISVLGRKCTLACCTVSWPRWEVSKADKHEAGFSDLQQDHQGSRAVAWKFPNHLLGWCSDVNVPLDYILEKFPLFAMFWSPAPGVGCSGDRGPGWQETLTQPSRP